jgi:hypothetical protein
MILKLIRLRSLNTKSARLRAVRMLYAKLIFVTYRLIKLSRLFVNFLYLIMEYGEGL